MSCRAFNRSASQVSEDRRSRSCGVLLRGVIKVEVPQARSAEGAETKVVTREPQAKCHDLDRFEEIKRSEPQNNQVSHLTPILSH